MQSLIVKEVVTFYRVTAVKEILIKEIIIENTYFLNVFCGLYYF